MNTLKRERIIKNLYDLQQLDSWEDGEHYMDCIECVRTQFAIKWRDFDDIISDLRHHYRQQWTGANTEDINEMLIEDDQYKLISKYNNASELFKEETNHNMKLDEFRSLCIQFMDFSHLI